MTSKARGLADLGNAYSDGALSNRNMIINGGMQVAQRGTSATGVGGSTGYFTVDRFKVGQNVTAGRLTMTQDADSPSGFANSIKLACTTSVASAGAAEVINLSYVFEGQDLQRIAKGTADAQQVTLSFYVKGNASATYAAELVDDDNSYRLVSKLFSVTSGWSRIEITFPADTTGALVDDNTSSLNLNIWLHSGSDFSSGTLQTAWGSYVAGNRAAGIDSFFSSTANTFQITGLQLEAGDTATPFEHRSYGDELARCQRYARVLGDGLSGSATSANTFNAAATLQPPMRSPPSLVVTDTSIKISDNYFSDHTSVGSSISYSGVTALGGRIGFVGFSGLTTGRFYNAYGNTNLTFVLLDAEL